MTACALVQNFSLPGEICRKFCVDWSPDNKISVCTSKAVYIMSSYCSPVETDFPSPFHKQVISAPEKVMQLQPIPFMANPYQLIESYEDQVNIHHLLMDHTLNPLPPERAEAFRSFRCAKWSPKGAAKNGRCILATLTMDHRLCLYEEIHHEWICICDLTEVLQNESEDIKKAKKLAELINKNGFQSKKKPQSESRRFRGRNMDLSQDESNEGFSMNPSEVYRYDDIAKTTFKLAPIEMTWTGMLNSPGSGSGDSSEYCYLIVAMKSGHIQFWRISASDSRTISLAHEWDSGLGLLTAICWQQTSPTAGFLMCGTLKGIFAFLPVALRSDADHEPLVVVKEICKVWDEEDHVAVDQIAVLKIALKKYVIIAAKQHALVGCEILLTDASIIIRNVGHSFGLHKMPITGMSVLDSNMPQFRLLIASMEGLFVEIKISVKDDEIKFQHEKMNVDLDLTHMMVQGLSVSPNGILCSVVLNTAVYYDHTAKKEPLQFAMFATRSFEEIYAKLKTLLKPAFSFLPATSVGISRYTDFLECIRINLACGTPLPDWLNAFVDSDPSTYNNSSDLELYTIRFLLHSYVTGLAQSVEKNKEELESKLSTVESLIMQKYISKVFGSCLDKIDLLTPAQGQSLLLMADWLLKKFQMPVETLYSALGCEMPVDAENLPARETCRVCQSEVKLESLKKGMCPNNHTFARCCQSLLLCDIVPYHQCPTCKSMALQDIWNFGLACTNCGMTMI